MADRQVKVTLVIDDKGSVKVLQKAGEESQKTEKHLGKLDKQVKGLGKSFHGLKGIIAGGIGALGLSGVAFGLKDVIGNTKEALDQTEKFHTISGTGTQQSLYYTAALKARGINAEAAGKAFAFLGSNIKTAERQERKYGLSQSDAAKKGQLTTAELGKQATAFKQLFGAQGVGALAGLSGEQKLAKTVKAFEDLSPAIKKSGDQAALMKEVFGRGGLSLATVLEGGATGLTHFTEVAKKFFPQIKGGQRGLEEWQVKNSEFHLGLEGLEFSLGMKLIPALKGVEEWFTKVALEVKRGKGPWGELGNTVNEVVGFFKGAWNVFREIVGPTNAVKLAVGGLVGVMVVGKVAGFVSALSGMGPALALIQPELLPIAAAIAGIYEGYKHIQQINEFLHPTIKVFKGPNGEEPYTGKGRQKEMRPGSPEYFKEGLGYSIAHHNTREATRELNQLAAQQKIDLHIDSAHFAEAIIRNPKAKRIVAEATAVYSQQMSARK